MIERELVSEAKGERTSRLEPLNKWLSKSIFPGCSMHLIDHVLQRSPDEKVELKLKWGTIALNVASTTHPAAWVIRGPEQQSLLLTSVIVFPLKLKCLPPKRKGNRLAAAFRKCVDY